MKNEEFFPLLSKLLSEEENKQTKEMHPAYVNFNDEVTKQLITVLHENIKYKNKSTVVTDLNFILRKIKLLIDFPELLGKTFIGIQETSTDTYYRIINYITQNGKTLIAYNKSIPSVIFNSDDYSKVRTVNLAGKIVNISEDEFKIINLDLADTYKIDIRQFLNFFIIPQKFRWNNIAFINLPLRTLKYKPYYKILLDMLDAIIIPIDDKQKWCSLYRNFSKCIGEKNIIAVTDKVNYVKLEEITVKAKISNVNSLNSWLQTYDIPRYNYYFSPSVRTILSKIDIQLQANKKNLEEILENIHDNSLKISDQKTKDVISKLNDAITGQLEECEKGISVYNCEEGQLLKFEKEIELYFSSNFKDASKAKYRNKHEDIIFNLCTQLIELDKFNVCKEYLRIFKNYFSEDKFIILSAYLNKNQNKNIPKSWINHIRDFKTDDLLAKRVIIKLNEDLNMEKEKIYSIIQSYEYIDDLTMQEAELLGDNYIQTDIKKAISFYTYALDLGSSEAASKLLKIPEYASRINLQKLALALNPDAAYKYGSDNFQHVYKKVGLRYLKIAAALNNLKAIRYLADYYYANNYYKDSKFEDNIIIMYSYLQAQGEEDKDLFLHLGKLFYRKKEYIRAYQCFMKVTEPLNGEAYYMIGCMYARGLGTATDMDQAEIYLKKSVELKYLPSYREYDKIYQKIKTREQNKASQKDSKKVVVKKVGTSWCFITTATCLALNKGDNCNELNAFRYFRDSYLKNEPDGAVLISEYYRIAPQIVAIIDARPNSLKIYQFLYKHYLSDCYKLILAKKFKAVKVKYMEMVIKLSRIFKIKIADQFIYR